ncbi:MAG: SPFH domain-containing protein [Pirellulaceae bacterium]|nr:SPFH domain-containing protein [Pirellulaceae bacterium]
MPTLLSWVLGIVFFPITLLASWVVVHPQEEKIVLFWGKLARVLKSPGLSFINLFGRKVITISTKQQAVEINKTTVADANANPIIVAGICTFRVVDSVKAALHVEDYLGFVRSQAAAVLKQVASKYPYESTEGHGLKDEAAKIGQEMVSVLARKVESAGVEVIAYELSDLRDPGLRTGGAGGQHEVRGRTPQGHRDIAQGPAGQVAARRWTRVAGATSSRRCPAFLVPYAPARRPRPLAAGWVTR